MVRSKASGQIEEEIASLGDLSRANLIERWVAYYKSPPPKGISRSLAIGLGG